MLVESGEQAEDGRASQKVGRGQEALLQGREELAVTSRELGGVGRLGEVGRPPGGLGGVGRPFWRVGRCRVTLPLDREG